MFWSSASSATLFCPAVGCWATNTGQPVTVASNWPWKRVHVPAQFLPQCGRLLLRCRDERLRCFASLALPSHTSISWVLRKSRWCTNFLALPLRSIKVPMGNMGVFDPTEIHNRGQLKSHMKESMIKLGYHLLCFFIYLYR